MLEQIMEHQDEIKIGAAIALPVLVSVNPRQMLEDLAYRVVNYFGSIRRDYRGQNKKKVAAPRTYPSDNNPRYDRMNSIRKHKRSAFYY